MKIIGLTGPSGSGKSFFCELLAKRGVASIDADRVYHSMLVPPSHCLDALAERFGKGILRADGTLDRSALSAIVFAPGAEAELADLNSITLKLVIEKIKLMIAELEKSGVAAVIVDAPTLFESGFDRDCDLTVAIIADRELRIERIMHRDRITHERAEARINAQKSDDFYKAHCDTVIYNDQNAEHLEALAENVLALAEGKKC